MPGAALALSGRVHPQERFYGLHNDPQLLPPREWLGRCREMAHAPQVLAVRRREVEPRLQAAAHHQREDEARAGSVQAVAQQWQQVRVAAPPQDLNLSVEIGQLQLAQIGALHRNTLQPLAFHKRRERLAKEDLPEAAAPNQAALVEPGRCLLQLVQLQ
eukprot:scaffold9999_cov68-Phaeocystis_antarctica.AAC.2